MKLRETNSYISQAFHCDSFVCEVSSFGFERQTANEIVKIICYVEVSAFIYALCSSRVTVRHEAVENC